MPTISSSSTGARSELLVAADLIARGFHVFRAVSPSSPCDLLVLDPADGVVVRVEVTAAYRRADGSVAFTRHDPSKFDLVAGVHADGSITYALGAEVWS